MAVDRDILELKRLVRGAARNIAMDAATAGISLTLAERQTIKYQQEPKYANRTVMMNGKKSPGARFVTQRHDKRLTVGSVSALDYKHSGQPALDFCVMDAELQSDHPASWPNPRYNKRSIRASYDPTSSEYFGRDTTQAKEQDAIEPDVNETDPESYDDTLSSEDRQQLTNALRAGQSDRRNDGGARVTGLEQANADYAARRGFKIARVS